MEDLLDFNHSEKTPTFADGVNSHIDTALVAENARQIPRDYLGGSRLGDACHRRLQYEYLHAIKDGGAGFSGKTLRIFALGHVLAEVDTQRELV